MIAYKVVRQLSSTGQARQLIFTSAFARGSAKILYQIDKQVEVPPWLQSLNMFPMLFSNQKYAYKWMECIVSSEMCLLACEVSGKVSPPEKMLLKPLARGKIIRYTDEHTGNPYHPVGTVSYKNIIPIKVL
jgi:hypothetical protein